MLKKQPDAFTLGVVDFFLAFPRSCFYNNKYAVPTYRITTAQKGSPQSANPCKKYVSRKPFEIDDADTRREHKLTTGVSLIRWGLICAQQRRRDGTDTRREQK